MSKLGEFSERVLDLAGQAGDGLQGVGDKAGKLLQTSAAIGVARVGAKTATQFVRRNPAVAIAVGVGLGLLAVAAVYRHHKRRQLEAPIEGEARRITPARAPARRIARKKVIASEE